MFDNIGANNINQNQLFKNGNYKFHIFNEKNIMIDGNIIKNIFTKYNFNHEPQVLKNYILALTHISYVETKIAKDKTAQLLSTIEPLSDEHIKNLDKIVKLQQTDYNVYEYFGDAVIKLIITEYLVKRYDTQKASLISNLRIKMEKSETLSFLSKKMGLNKYVLIGRNMEYANARENDMHLTEDIFEAFIWALYLETDYSRCYEFVVNIFEKELDFSEMLNTHDNYKIQLLSVFRKKYENVEPIYFENRKEKKVINNNNHYFVVYVYDDHEKKIIGWGDGNTKIKAEQNSALNALQQLDEIDKEKTPEKLYYANEYQKYVLNPNNVRIDKSIIDNIYKRYNLEFSVNNTDEYQQSFCNVSYGTNPMGEIEYQQLVGCNDNIHLDNKNCIELQKKNNSLLVLLGNAVIRMVLTEYLNLRYENKNQEFLTKLRINIENCKNLSIITKELNIGKYTLLSRDFEQKRYIDAGILKSVFESFIGITYLNVKYQKCKDFLIHIFEDIIDFSDILSTDNNYKTMLMQFFHKIGKKLPIYDTFMNDNNVYTTSLYDIDKFICKTENLDKTQAEQDCAYLALCIYGQINENTNNNDYYGEDDSD